MQGQSSNMRRQERLPLSQGMRAHVHAWRAGRAAICVIACSAASTAAVARSRPHARTMSPTTAGLPN